VYLNCCGLVGMATLRQAAVALASLLGRPRVDGVLHARALVDVGLADPGKPGSFGGNKSPAAMPQQAALLALSMSSGMLPKAAVHHAEQFFGLPLVSGYRAFQNDDGIQSRSIGDLEAVHGARFGDMLAQIITSYRLGVDPSGLRPGLQFTGCMFGVLPSAAFGSLDWRAPSPDAEGYWVSDHFSFLGPGAVAPSPGLLRQVFISADVFAHLGALLREHGGGGGLGEVSERVTEGNDGERDFKIAASPDAIAPGAAALH
jgi:hypothetical protein